MAALHARAFSVPRPWSAAEFTDLAASLLVFAFGDARGFVLGRVIADEAEVLTLAVAPEARRQGVARGLMAAFAAEGQRRGAMQFFLEVAADNTAALALYEGCGFAVTGRRRGYFGTVEGRPLDALVMARRVQAPPDAALSQEF